MLRHSAFAAFLITLLYAAWIFNQAGAAMRPYRDVILHAYGVTILAWIVLFYVTTTALMMLLLRSVFLKNTGQKLQHTAKDSAVPAVSPQHTPPYLTK